MKLTNIFTINTMVPMFMIGVAMAQPGNIPPPTTGNDGSSATVNQVNNGICVNNSVYDIYSLFPSRGIILEWVCNGIPLNGTAINCRELDDNIGWLKDEIAKYKEALKQKGNNLPIFESLIEEIQIWTREEVEEALEDDQRSLKDAEETMKKARKDPLNRYGCVFTS